MIIAWPQSESYYKVYHHSKSCIGGRGNFFARCEREKRGSPQNGEGSSFVPPLLGLGERVVLVHHLAEVVASLQGTLLAQVVYNHQGLYVEDQVYKPKGRGYCSSDELSSNKVYATQEEPHRAQERHRTCCPSPSAQSRPAIAQSPPACSSDLVYEGHAQSSGNARVSSQDFSHGISAKDKKLLELLCSNKWLSV